MSSAKNVVSTDRPNVRSSTRQWNGSNTAFA